MPAPERGPGRPQPAGPIAGGDGRPAAAAPAPPAAGAGEPGAVDLASLEPLFRPRSVAVIGASADPARIGGIPIRLMRQFGFPGPIYPVNPTIREAQGLPAYPDITAVPGPVDQVIFAVPERLVVPALEQCARVGVRAAVMFSAGFAEVGEEGRRQQERVATVARAGGIRVLGPNCLGVVHFARGMFSTFSPGFGDGFVREGRIALVTQSGAFGGYSFVLARDRGLGLSYWVTTGNEADVDVAACIAFLAEDPETTAILAYLEAARDGTRLRAALERARARGKPVVAVKVGRTELGAVAAASHTASLAGADAVYDAVFRQHGAWRAQTVEEFFDLGYALAVGRRPASRRVGMVTVSGGVGVLMADEVTAHGLEAPPLPEAAQAALKALVPFAAVRNPVDITGQLVNDIGLFERSIETVVAEGDYASVVCFQGSAGRSPVNGPRIEAVWQRMRREHPDTLVAIVGVTTPAGRHRYEADGCLVFDDPTRAIRAVAALTRLAEDLARPAAPVAAAPAPPLPPGPYTEAAALAVLRAAGLPTVDTRHVRSADEAARAAAELGGPVAVKVVSAALTHKSDVGGVALGIATPDEAAAAYAAVLARVRQRAPGAAIDGCLVAPMVSGVCETILGVHRDPVFGPVVMVGLGGVLVEVLRDVAFRAAPVDPDEARRMLAELRGARLLEGVRGRPPADVDALVDALVRLSRFAAAHAGEIESLDVNPFIVRARGQGGCAVDAVLLRRGATP
jgi:acyl-CoA synthetase (NDP forming)